MGKHEQKTTKKTRSKRTQLIIAVFLLILVVGILFAYKKISASEAKKALEIAQTPEATPAPAVTAAPEIKAAAEPKEEKKEEEELHSAADELVINELMSFNRWYLRPKEKNRDQDKNYYDWIEIKNISDHDISLSDYYLSDGIKDFFKYNLPDTILEPDGIYVVWCRGDDIFNVGDNETVYLIDKDGELQDMLSASGVRYSCSCGRVDGKDGRFIFSTPTPGAENEEGFIEYSDTPVLIGEDGVFNGVNSVTFELSSEGDIYYTLDGSIPTSESEKYDGPITVDRTTVVRAATIEEGRIESDTLDLSFIINENHTLPVTSLVISPDDFRGKKTGLYNHVTEDIERQCSVKYMDGEDGFYRKSGLKIHGATSKLAQPKKSMKLKFRGVYGGDLEYNLFDNGVTEFESLILRSAQELHITTLIRDIFFQQLAKQCYEDMPIQDYKFTVLYINGEYWGIYAYREQHSEKHYANHSEYKKNDIELYEGEWPSDGEFEEVYKLAMNGDIRKDDVYQQVAEHVDIDALITWALIQGYSGNEDIEAHNVKFYYTKSDQVLHYALVDLDLGGDKCSVMPVELWYDYGRLFNRLLQNRTFKTQLLEKAAEYLKGPLSDENAFALRDSIADEIRAEIPRDAERWQYKASDWERDVDEIMVINTNNGSCAKNFALTIKYWLDIRSEDFNQYLGDIE